MNKNMDEKKGEYLKVPIPEELEFKVDEAFQKGLFIRKRKKVHRKIATACALAAAFAFFTLGVNMNPAVAKSLEKVPLIGGIVQVLTINEIEEKTSYLDVDIKVPAVEGMKDKEAEAAINEAFQENAEKTFQVTKEKAELIRSAVEASGLKDIIPAIVSQSYEVKCLNDRLLSLGVVTLEVAASGYETAKYYNIDLVSNNVLKLEDLFVPEYDYATVINEYIEEQIKEQMNDGSGRMYFTEGEEAFQGIKPVQQFFIDQAGQLVIAFDEYEIAPGFMGRPEFVILTEKIKDGLRLN